MSLCLHLFLDGKGFKNEHATERGPATQNRASSGGTSPPDFTQAEAEVFQVQLDMWNGFFWYLVPPGV